MSTTSFSMTSHSQNYSANHSNSLSNVGNNKSSLSGNNYNTSSFTTTNSSTVYDPRNIDKAIYVLQGKDDKEKERPDDAERLRKDLITFLQFFQVPDSKEKKIKINPECKRNIVALRGTVKDLLKEKGFQRQSFDDILEGFESLVKGISSEHPEEHWTLISGGQCGDSTDDYVGGGGVRGGKKKSRKESKSIRKKSSLKRIMKQVSLKGNSSTKERIKKVSSALSSKKSKDRVKLEDAVYDTYKDTIRIFWKRPQIGYELHPLLFKRYHKLAEEHLSPVNLYDPPREDYEPGSEFNPYTKAHRPVLKESFSDYTNDEKKAIVSFLFSVQDRKKNPRSAKQKSLDKKLGQLSKSKKKSESSDSEIAEIKKEKRQKSLAKCKFVIKSLQDGSSVKPSVLRGYYIYGRRYNVISKNTTIREFMHNPIAYLKDILAYMQKNNSAKTASGAGHSLTGTASHTASQTISHTSSHTQSSPPESLHTKTKANNGASMKGKKNLRPTSPQSSTSSTTEQRMSLSSLDDSGKVIHQSSTSNENRRNSKFPIHSGSGGGKKKSKGKKGGKSAEIAKVSKGKKKSKDYEKSKDSSMGKKKKNPKGSSKPKSKSKKKKSQKY